MEKTACCLRQLFWLIGEHFLYTSVLLMNKCYISQQSSHAVAWQIRNLVPERRKITFSYTASA